MDRKLREGAERIRWIEGFDVSIRRTGDSRLPTIYDSYVKYDFTRAASRKWTVEYWKQMRFAWDGLALDVRMPDGEIVGDSVPLDVPRQAFRLEKWYQKPPFGTTVKFTFQAPSDKIAMHLREDLRSLGIDTEYRLEKFLFMKSHLLYWNSPPIHLMTYEWNSFIAEVSHLAKSLDSHFEWNTESITQHFIDEFGYSYQYFTLRNLI